MEKFVEQTLMFDFYGELLTEHQQKIYKEAVFDDLSVSEIARNEGITRQGAHDLIKRCNKLLEEYEERLHLVERFIKIKEQVREIKKLAVPTSAPNENNKAEQIYSETENNCAKERFKRIDSIASDILEEL